MRDLFVRAGASAAPISAHELTVAHTDVGPDVLSGEHITGYDLLLIGVAAVLLRAGLYLFATWLHGWSLLDFVKLRDSSSYIHYAEAIRGDGGALTLFDRRVFPGYPALIAGVSALGLAIPSAALLLSWFATATTAVLTTVLYKDRRVGWALVMLTPSYLMYSSMVMSESVLLAFTVAGLVLAYRSRGVLAGLLLGFAGLVRPMACFAVIGAGLERLRRRVGTVVAMCVVSALVVAVGLLVLRAWTGDAFQNVRIYAHDNRAYAGQLLALPFESLIMTPIRWPVPLWKIVYVWTYVLLTLAGCYVLARDAWTVSRPEKGDVILARLNAPWLIGNTAFVLCIGSVWGFQEFHRFIIPALPPLLWAFRQYYPRRPLGWFLVALCSFSMALFGLVRSS